MRAPSKRTRPTLRARLLVCVAGVMAAACGSGADGVEDAAGAVAPLAAVRATARFELAGIAFDYPATWHVTRAAAMSPRKTVVAYLGTGSVKPDCAPPGDAGASAGASADASAVPSPAAMACAPAYELGPGELVMAVLTFGGPDFDILAVPPAAEPVLADWLPGYQESEAPDPSTGADARTTWTLPVPGSIDNAYRLVLDTREPGGAAAVDEVRAILESIMYHPPAP
ncbi:MAG: hypothetical protein WCK58_12460, partial [Chloroflexota bacterium]